MKLVLLSLVLILLAAANPVAAQCDYDFCPTGITYPTAIVNPEDPVADQAPCSLIPLGILAGEVTAEDCTDLPALEYVCCPPGGALPCGNNTTIEFCPNGIDDPNTIINPTDPVEDHAPCGFVIASLALGVVPDEDCLAIPFAESICCPGSNGTTVPGGNSTIPPNNDTATEGSCLFCGSDVPFKREKTWAGEDICAQFDEQLAGLPAGDFCTNFITDLIAEDGFDFQSYCECEGKALPDLCTVCPDDKEIVADKEILGANGLTCGRAAEYVKHVADATRCGEFVTPEVQAVCCVTKEGKKESSGMGLAMSGLASGLLFVLAFII